MWIYNPDDFKIIESNKAAAALHGYTRDEMKSLTIKELRPKGKVVRLVHAVENIEQSFNDSGIWQHQNKNKETFFVHIHSHPVEWDDKLCRLVVARDVSDKIQVNRKLRQSREQLQKIMDQSPAVICTADADGRFVQVSAATQHIWGYRPENLIHKRFINFVHPDDVDSTNNIADEIIKGREVTAFENRYIRADGGIVPMEWSARWDREDGLMYCVARDATAIKEAEQKIARERNMLRAIIDNLPDYIYVKDRQKRLILGNKAMTRDILGDDSEKKILGKNSYEIFEPEIAQPIDEDDQKVIETGESVIDRQEVAYDHEGNRIWLLTTKVPLQNQNNEVYGLVGITRNVTEQKEAQDQIRFAKERYEMVIKASKDTVFDWNFVTNTLSWGSNFISTFGDEADTEKYTAEYWIENIHPGDQQRIRESIKQVLETPSESKWEAEYRYLNTEGTYADILENAFIIRDEDGTPVRMIGALQDITALKQKEQEVRESLKEKEILLAEIHHRVKNNLAVVSGIMQLQAFEEDDNELKGKLIDCITRIQSIADIHEQLYRSSSFAKLDFSENLKHLVRSIIDTFQSEKATELDFNFEPVQLNVNQAIPASLIINEVVTNILKHAFKETDTGTVIFDLAQVNDAVLLKISDNGAGLPGNFAKKKGKTLGLQLIDELAKQLDADYGYESTGEGSVFTLQFEKSDLKGTGNAYL